MSYESCIKFIAVIVILSFISNVRHGETALMFRVYNEICPVNTYLSSGHIFGTNFQAKPVYRPYVELEP